MVDSIAKKVAEESIDKSLKEVKVLLDDVDQGNYEYMPKTQGVKNMYIDHVEEERLADLAREKERDRLQFEMFDDPTMNWSGKR